VRFSNCIHINNNGKNLALSHGVYEPVQSHLEISYNQQLRRQIVR
jgi:hypothetical protein